MAPGRYQCELLHPPGVMRRELDTHATAGGVREDSHRFNAQMLHECERITGLGRHRQVGGSRRAVTGATRMVGDHREAFGQSRQRVCDSQRARAQRQECEQGWAGAPGLEGQAAVGKIERWHGGGGAQALGSSAGKR